MCVCVCVCVFEEASLILPGHFTISLPERPGASTLIQHDLTDCC